MDEQTDERKDLIYIFLKYFVCHMYDLNPYNKKNIITRYKHIPKHIPRQCNFPVMKIA